MSGENGLAVTVFVFLAVGLVVYLVARYVRDRDVERHGDAGRAAAAKIAGVEIALIKEEIEITSWGTFCRIGLTVAIIIETFGVLGAKNYFDAIQAGCLYWQRDSLRPGRRNGARTDVSGLSNRRFGDEVCAARMTLLLLTDGKTMVTAHFQPNR